MTRQYGMARWLAGEGGVVVIDVDRATVRLVRNGRGGEAGGPAEDPSGLEAQEVLMGFLRLTGRG